MLAQLIAPSGRPYRRDVAILKSLGLLQRQVSSVTAWQVSTLAVLALRAGVPLGGRRAGGRGRCSPPAVVSAGRRLDPGDVILVIVPAVLLAADAVAAGPGRSPAAACRNIAGRVGPRDGAAGARHRSPGRSGRRVSWW